MANEVYSCTECKPVDTSIIEAYLALVRTMERAKAGEEYRNSAEFEREAAESARSEDERIRQGNEEDRNRQEELRVLSEQDRVSAEGERERVSGIDHAQYTADHGVFVEDHQIATDDHLRSASDHTRAEIDHNRAEDDHSLIRSSVLFTPQILTDEQKEQARENIGAGAGSGTDAEAVHFTEQTLTTEQQAQARTNIGAGTSSFSGNYNDLSNKPTIPDVTGKADKVTSPTSGNFAGLDGNGNLVDSGKKASDFATALQGGKADTAYQKPQTGIPSSDLAAGVIPDVSNFITKSVDDLTNYYLKSETYTQAEVQALIGAISQFHYEIAASTSAVSSPANNVLYLIGPTGSGADKYEEYVYPNSTQGWVKIGDTSVDLSGYVTTQALNTALADYTATSSLASVALSGSYNDLLNKPTIPAAQVNSDWNASSGVAQILNKPSIPTVESMTNSEIDSAVNTAWV